MIRIMLGLPGSGKTACMVRELVKNPSRKITYSNIKTWHIENNRLITPRMIAHKDHISTKKTGEKVYKLSLNQEYWKNIVRKEKSINVILDEAHTLIDSRKSMSNINKVMSDFLSLIRRIIGSNEMGYGQLVLISQLERRLDIIAREMATNVRYHRCHYRKFCNECNYQWAEHNEIAEPLFHCKRCHSFSIVKKKHVIEVWEFKNIELFMAWRYLHKKKQHFKHYFITDIEKYFELYDTLQWENLVSEF